MSTEFKNTSGFVGLNEKMEPEGKNIELENQTISSSPFRNKQSERKFHLLCSCPAVGWSLSWEWILISFNDEQWFTSNLL